MSFFVASLRNNGSSIRLTCTDWSDIPWSLFQVLFLSYALFQPPLSKILSFALSFLALRHRYEEETNTATARNRCHQLISLYTTGEDCKSSPTCTVHATSPPSASSAFK